jgi:hypothetical protein
LIVNKKIESVYCLLQMKNCYFSILFSSTSDIVMNDVLISTLKYVIKWNVMGVPHGVFKVIYFLNGIQWYGYFGFNIQWSKTERCDKLSDWIFIKWFRKTWIIVVFSSDKKSGFSHTYMYILRNYTFNFFINNQIKLFPWSQNYVSVFTTS